MTLDQNNVSSTLNSLKFEGQESDSKNTGGPVVFKVTEETLTFLKDKTVTVGSDGTLTVE